MDEKLYKDKLQKAFEHGVATGIKMMMDKLEHQCRVGKPIEANGNLYWLTGSRQHLIDVMDDIEKKWNLEQRN